jgi:Rrf2 family iron-sulfur cluster assembly transcriptional regulator
MQLQASEEYGLRCLLQVAGAGVGERVSIARIAESEGLSPEYTAKLMRQLRLGELVHSTRGADGGYRLARPAGEISVWQALQVLGGAFFDSRFCDCHGGARRACVRNRDCSVRALWRIVQQSVRTTLEGVTLQDLGQGETEFAVWLDRNHDGSPTAARTRTQTSA